MELTQSPIVSMLCPPPVNAIITNNTFVQFDRGQGIKVGLVLNLNPVQRLVSIRLFLCWDDVVERIGLANIPENISFWPTDNRNSPHYICDTDIILSDVPLQNILGLAFVFFDSSSKIREIAGMRNTYRVTSCVWFSRHLITHGNTFKSFPSERFPSIVLSCFPSTIFTQLICVKREIQRLLNTRSLSSKNSAVVHVQNIDMYTWMYMLKESPVRIEASSIVTRSSLVHFDEFIQVSHRETQLSIWLGDSTHLAFGQALFGMSFGIGVRFTVSCRLPRGQTYAEALQQIDPSRTLNVIPFEDNCREVVRRGIHFRYKPASKVLSVTVRYRRMIGAQNFLPHFQVRGMVHVHDEDGRDIYPFHRDVLVDGCNIEQYNFLTRTVRLSDNRHLHINDVIDILNRDLF